MAIAPTGLHHSEYLPGVFLIFLSACWVLLEKDMKEYMDFSNFQCQF